LLSRLWRWCPLSALICNRLVISDLSPLSLRDALPTSSHPLVTGRRDAHQQQGEGADDSGLTDDAELLYDMALIAEGGELSDPSRFVTLLSNRLATSS